MPHSIITTRHMAKVAKEQQEPPPTPPPPLPDEPPAEERQFFGEVDLELAIPMEDEQDRDILYNMHSSSVASSYSRLEQVLFGLPNHSDSPAPQ